MPILRKVTQNDFPKVYPLLQEFNNARLTEAHWRRLFENHWNIEDNYYGYLLEDGEKVVGYLGAIFSERWIHEKKYNFCNLTSWYVEKEYRGNSRQYLESLLAMENCTIVNLTCNPITARVFEKNNFIPYETHTRKILKFPHLQALWKKVKVLNEKEELWSFLSKAEKKFYEDHSTFNCSQILLTYRDSYCYLVITKRGKKGKIHFISNKQFFRECIAAFVFKLCKQLEVISLQLDERYVQNKRIFGSVRKTLSAPKFYYSTHLQPEHIDELYTELLLLG